MNQAQIAAFLERLKAEGCYRERKRPEKALMDLSSNDYLGLSFDAKLRQSFMKERSDALPAFSGTGSPLLSGFSAETELLERELTRFMGRPCLTLNSGFDTNAGVLEALSDRDTLILADKLAHASLITGMQLARGRCLRFAHNDMEHLKTLFNRYAPAFKTVIIVTEALFSMDGDYAPLRELASFKRAHADKVLLYVDEAHSFFIYGKGRGLCAQLGLLEDVDFMVGTFGKALGGCGAFISTSQLYLDYLINMLRPYIFSTALPPVVWAWDRHVLARAELFEERRERLFGLIERCQRSLEPLRIPVRSPILSLLTGSPLRAIALSRSLRKAGFVARPIRYPTVPKGRERVRVTLNATLSDEDIARLIQAIRAFNDEGRVCA